MSSKLDIPTTAIPILRLLSSFGRNPWVKIQPILSRIWTFLQKDNNANRVTAGFIALSIIYYYVAKFGRKRPQKSVRCYT